jgi:hypothetical protein
MNKVSRLDFRPPFVDGSLVLGMNCGVGLREALVHGVV